MRKFMIILSLRLRLLDALLFYLGETIPLKLKRIDLVGLNAMTIHFNDYSKNSNPVFSIRSCWGIKFKIPFGSL
jgi:hypothetical protein